MSTNDDLTREEADLLGRMVRSLTEHGLNDVGGTRLYAVGEWGYCFSAIYYASKESDTYKKQWRKEMRAFNTLFASRPYFRRNGFPLEID